MHPNFYKLNLHAFLITHFAFICEASANILKVGPNAPPRSLRVNDDVKCAYYDEGDGVDNDYNDDYDDNDDIDGVDNDDDDDYDDNDDIDDDDDDYPFLMCDFQVIKELLEKLPAAKDGKVLADKSILM